MKIQKIILLFFVIFILLTDGVARGEVVIKFRGCEKENCSQWNEWIPNTEFVLTLLPFQYAEFRYEVNVPSNDYLALVHISKDTPGNNLEIVIGGKKAEISKEEFKGIMINTEEYTEKKFEYYVYESKTGEDHAVLIKNISSEKIKVKIVNLDFVP